MGHKDALGWEYSLEKRYHADLEKGAILLVALRCSSPGPSRQQPETAFLTPGRREGSWGPTHSLVPLAGVAELLIAVGTSPAWLAVADGPLGSIGLADAMETVQLTAWLTAWHHTRLHLGLGEVL